MFACRRALIVIGSFHYLQFQRLSNFHYHYQSPCPSHSSSESVRLVKRLFTAPILIMLSILSVRVTYALDSRQLSAHDCALRCHLHLFRPLLEFLKFFLWHYKFINYLSIVGSLHSAHAILQTRARYLPHAAARWSPRHRGDAENARQENVGLEMRHQTAMVENAGLEMGEMTLYGTPYITYVCSVLQDATIDNV